MCEFLKEYAITRLLRKHYFIIITQNNSPILTCYGQCEGTFFQQIIKAEKLFILRVQY